MKKNLLLLCCAAAACCGARAQQPVVRFGADGTCTIAQFTDTHLDLSTEYRRGEAEKTLARMAATLDAERPDLVVFTGDVVTGAPAAEGWRRILAPLGERGIPFFVVLGNHDAEQDITRRAIAEIVTSCPTTLNTMRSGELDDLVVELRSARGETTAALLYGFDSHAESPRADIEGYAWFTPDQVAAYRAASAAHTARNGGRPLPALAFFHIALQEYATAWRNPDNSRIGRAAEDECPGALNTGMFAAMVESGDVMGTFVGHDHDIDYVVCDRGIALGYGRYSGDDTTYNNLRSGVRIIRLTEGERGFETWIREGDGRVVDRVKVSGGAVSEEIRTRK